MKKCYICGKTKKIDEFSLDRNRKDGRSPDCKTCNRQRSREYYHNNREKVNERHRRYAQTERGKKISLANVKRWQRKNKHKTKAQDAVGSAIRNGSLPRAKTQTCQDCENKAHHWHHEDYNNHLDVVPLCMSCHRKRHQEKQNG